MATGNEPAKLILPYLQRADELQNHDPLVAYYCRFYAMERGLRIPQSDRTKTTNALLVSLMKQLEKDKKSLNLGPDDHLHVEGFALNIFARADKQDRAGRADLNTAKTFYAASIFFEILNQFGELQADLEQKQKYAAWKAADIRKAVKDGRKPLPGPPGGDQDPSLPSTTSIDEYDLEPSGTNIAHSAATADPIARAPPDSDSSFQAHDQDSFQPSPKFARQSSYIPPSSPSNISPQPKFPDSYPSNNLHIPPSTNKSSHENSIHHQSYHQPEPQHHLSQHYSSNDVPSYSYPNFQSYPSFSESSLPATPSDYPSHYQGSDVSFLNSPPSNTARRPLTQHNPNGKNGSVSEVSQPSMQTYEYDGSYQPPPEKIAEAHKAARFAVGALAFDDVSVAVDYLKKSLELLTNPSAEE